MMGKVGLRSPMAPGSAGHRQRAVLLVLLVALAMVATWLLYATFSRANVAIWDFHPRWVGLRAMLLEGHNPYSDEVTRLIQQRMYGRPAYADEDQLAFAYPLSALVLLGPLALLPLPVAQAIWYLVLGGAMVAFIVIAPWAVGWRPSPWLLALTAFFSLGLYPNVWALILGQISIVVAGLLALAWWGLRIEHWALAGVCLALATIKPQMTFLIVPAVLIGAIARWHWRLVSSFAVTLGAILLLPMLWMPDWPLEWAKQAGSYMGYTIFEPPAVMLTGSAVAGWVIAGALVAWLVICASPLLLPGGHRRATPYSRPLVSDWALSMLVVISALVAPRTSQANQLVLLLPLFFVLTRLPGQTLVAAVEIILLVGLWLMAALLLPPTSSPQHTLWQHRLISPILPVGLTIALLALSPWPRREVAG
jgi:hypothetical protein